MDPVRVINKGSVYHGAVWQMKGGVSVGVCMHAAL